MLDSMPSAANYCGLSFPHVEKACDRGISSVGVARKRLQNERMRKSEVLPGAQTVGRAVALLRLLASSKSRDLRLVDIAEIAGLDRSTAHRLLQRLVQEQMVSKDKAVGGYRLGPLMGELGLAAHVHDELRELAHPFLAALADATGEIAILLRRSGCECVCVDRVEGRFAIQTQVQGIGDRHPMGLGAGGLALLSAMDDVEVDSILTAIAHRLRYYRMTEVHLREQIRQTRERGYAVTTRTAALPLAAFGRVLRGPQDRPLAAVFLVTLRERFDDVRFRRTDAQLRSCIASIESALRGAPLPA